MSPSLIVFVTAFIDLIGFGIVLPLLPSYASRYHVSDTRIGLVVASFSLMQFLLAPRWGRLSDRIGRRPVLLVGLLGSTASYLLFAFAGGFWSLLLSRVVAGAMGATVNVAQAYLADITPPEGRSRAMGLIGAAFGLGFVVGPAIGGISSHWGSAAPGLVAAALSGANLIFAWFRLPETREHVQSGTPPVPLHWRRLAVPFAVIACTTVAFTVLYVVFPLQVERGLGYDVRQVSYCFVLLGLVTAVVQGGLVGRLAARVSEARLMLVGSLLLAAGMALLPVSLVWRSALPERVPLLVGALLLLGFGPGLVGPSATGYVSRLAPQEEQGRALGSLQSVAAVARIGGPILAGVLNAHLGPEAAFLVAAGAAALGALISVA